MWQKQHAHDQTDPHQRHPMSKDHMRWSDGVLRALAWCVVFYVCMIWSWWLSACVSMQIYVWACGCFVYMFTIFNECLLQLCVHIRNGSYISRLWSHRVLKILLKSHYFSFVVSMPSKLTNHFVLIGVSCVHLFNLIQSYRKSYTGVCVLFVCMLTCANIQYLYV